MTERFSSEEQQAQARIRDKWQALQGLSAWEVLGLTAKATESQIKQAYFGLAREFHTDAYAGLRLGDATPLRDEVFARIAEAHDSLTDPHKRGELDAKSTLEAAGTSTDVGALLDAEQHFSKGRSLLERGDMLASARLFEGPAKADASNPEWQAHHLFASWWVKRDLADAKRRSEALERLAKSAPLLLDIMYFAARLAHEGGDDERGERLMRRVLRDDPNHRMASRDRRLLLKRREEQAKKKGFFAKLLGR